VLDIGVARRDLAVRDRQGAIRAIDDALLAVNRVSDPSPAFTQIYAARPASSPAAPVSLAPPAIGVAPLAPAPPTAVPSPPAPLPPPTVTYALLPGHWQLKGARYVWIPPETTPRLVVTQQFVPNESVWKSGHWVFVPSHYTPEPGD
jgi:hypothetical protein